MRADDPLLHRFDLQNEQIRAARETEIRIVRGLLGARSVKGDVQDEIPLQPKSHNWFVPEKGRAFVGTMGRAAASSTVVLRTFSGKIHLKKHSEK